MPTSQVPGPKPDHFTISFSGYGIARIYPEVVGIDIEDSTVISNVFGCRRDGWL